MNLCSQPLFILHLGHWGHKGEKEIMRMNDVESSEARFTLGSYVEREDV